MTPREQELFAERLEYARTIGALRAKLSMLVEYVDQMTACEDVELKRSFERAMRNYVDRLKGDPEVSGAEGKTEKEVVHGQTSAES